ncbi:hypothetical protein NDU88_002445 [Pleurodeles waltl]|uniref:Uncharacterized protein n=1 Tax=Pleurodeles waltl TaxID=8319 RepID=A0AAV7NFE9_PLEWA|nr:hypothetical protein NDU88_002445 [Pleurodeles waltl]
MDQLFRALHWDFATLKQEIAAEVKELKRKVVELRQRVDTLEQARVAQEVELDRHRRELLILHDKNLELQHQLEDLENRSRSSNIRIKGVPPQAVTGKLEDFVERLFRHVAPDLRDQTLVLDGTHRVGRMTSSPGQAQDRLTRLHHYKQQEIIMMVARDHPVIEFEGFHVGLFQDLSLQTLQRCRAFRPVTDFLRDNGIKCKWGHPFRLQFIWQNETCIVRTMVEAQALEGMLLRFGDGPSSPGAREGCPWAGTGQPKHRTRCFKQAKPSTAKSQKERAALLRRLCSQDSISDVDSDL